LSMGKPKQAKPIAPGGKYDEAMRFELAKVWVKALELGAEQVELAARISRGNRIG